MLILRILFYILALYSFVLVGLFLLQDRIIFQPSGEKFGHCPLAAHLGFQSLTTPKGVRYYSKVSGEPRAHLLYFHGNAGSACSRLSVLEEFEDLHLRLSILEYPGYGGSREKPSERSFIEAATELYNELSADGLPVFLFGESIGSAVAVYIASQNEVAGSILQAPAASLVDVGRRHYPWLPVRWLLRNTFSSETWAPSVKSPVLILLAQRDEVIPPRSTEALADKFSGSVELVRLTASRHNDMAYRDSEIYWGAIRRFLAGLKSLH